MTMRVLHIDDSSARSRAANRNPFYAKSNPKLTNNKNPQYSEPIPAKTWKNRRLFGKIETHSFDFGINENEKNQSEPIISILESAKSKPSSIELKKGRTFREKTHSTKRERREKEEFFAFDF